MKQYNCTSILKLLALWSSTVLFSPTVWSSGSAVYCAASAVSKLEKIDEKLIIPNASNDQCTVIFDEFQDLEEEENQIESQTKTLGPKECNEAKWSFLRQKLNASSLSCIYGLHPNIYLSANNLIQNSNIVYNIERKQKGTKERSHFTKRCYMAVQIALHVLMTPDFYWHKNELTKDDGVSNKNAETSGHYLLKLGFVNLYDDDKFRKELIERDNSLKTNVLKSDLHIHGGLRVYESPGVKAGHIEMSINESQMKSAQIFYSNLKSSDPVAFSSIENQITIVDEMKRPSLTNEFFLPSGIRNPKLNEPAKYINCSDFCKETVYNSEAVEPYSGSDKSLTGIYIQPQFVIEVLESDVYNDEVKKCLDLK